MLFLTSLFERNSVWSDRWILNEKNGENDVELWSKTVVVDELQWESEPSFNNPLNNLRWNFCNTLTYTHSLFLTFIVEGEKNESVGHLSSMLTSEATAIELKETEKRKKRALGHSTTLNILNNLFMSISVWNNRFNVFTDSIVARIRTILNNSSSRYSLFQQKTSFILHRFDQIPDQSFDDVNTDIVSLLFKQ